MMEIYVRARPTIGTKSSNAIVIWFLTMTVIPIGWSMLFVVFGMERMMTATPMIIGSVATLLVLIVAVIVTVKGQYKANNSGEIEFSVVNSRVQVRNLATQMTIGDAPLNQCRVQPVWIQVPTYERYRRVGLIVSVGGHQIVLGCQDQRGTLPNHTEKRAQCHYNCSLQDLAQLETAIGGQSSFKMMGQTW